MITPINCSLREVLECANKREKGKERRAQKYYDQWRRNCSSRLISDPYVRVGGGVSTRRQRRETNSGTGKIDRTFEHEIGQEIVVNSFDPVGFNYQ